MAAKIKHILNELRTSLESLYGERLHRIVLFGSYARGESLRGSDIDVLVVLKDDFDTAVEISRAGEITSALSLEHDVVISCTFISRDRYENEYSPLLLNIRREGIVI